MFNAHRSAIPLLVALSCALAVSAAGPAGAVLGPNARATITVGNGSFEAGFNEDYELVYMSDSGTGETYTFDPDESSLWRVLVAATAWGDSLGPEDLAWVTPSDVVAVRDTVRRPTDEGQLLTFVWGDAVFAPGETLDVEVDVLVPWDRPETRWSISVVNRTDDRATFAVDFPVVGVEALGADGKEDDVLLLPIGPGSVVDDPIDNVHLDLGLEDGISHSGAGYNDGTPGFWFAQFAYLYDSSELRGLVFATEDTAGYYRRNEFSGTGASGVLEHCVRHYPEDNVTPGGNYAAPYPVVIRSTEGDWIDAAKEYRAWALEQPWCRDEALLSSEVAAVAGAVKFDAGACAGGSADTAYARIAEQLEYFAGSELLAHLRGWAWWDYLATGEIHPAVVELASRLISEGVRVAPYTSTRGWSKEQWPGGQGEEFVARNANGREYFQGAYGLYVMCPASGWADYYADRVSDLAAMSVATDFYLDQYPAAKLCYSAHGRSRQGGTGSPAGCGREDHADGGGNYWFQGFRRMLARIASENPGAFMMNESRFEMLAPVLDASFCEYWERGPSQAPGPSAVPGGLPVPLVACLYHDFVAQVGGASAYWETYASELTYEFQQAYSFANGGKFIVLADSTAMSRYPEVCPGRDEAWSYLKKLIAYHSMAPDYLGRGEWIRPPDTDYSEIDVPFSWDPPYPSSLPFQRVLAGAFKATDGTVALVFTNFTDEVVAGEFTFDLGECGLPGPDYVIERWTPSDGPSLRANITGSVYSDTLAVGAHDVVFLRIADSTTTGIGEGAEQQPAAFHLTRAFPCPARAGLAIGYESTGGTTVALRIYDVAGRTVAEWTEELSGGPGVLWWDCRSGDGSRVASGVYFARAVAGASDSRIKLVVVR